MFVLKTLHLENFGAIKEATFSPNDNSLTSIYGANGNGKSSFLDAIVWALFGVLPKERNKSEIRSFFAGEKEKTKVIVDFEHNGDIIKVTRSMSAKGSVTAEIKMNDDNTPLTKITPTTSVNWIKKRLGINEEGFTKAFAIRQKQLDDLVTSAPTKRREIIERISGVDRLSKAVKMAKEDEKKAKIVFENTINPQEEIDSLKEKLTMTEKTFHQIESKLEEANTETAFARKAKESLYEQWQELVSYRQVYLDVSNEIQNFKHQKNIIQSQIDSHLKRINEKKKHITSDKETLQQEFDTAKEKATQLRTTISQTKESSKTLDNAINRFEQSIESADSSIEKNKNLVKVAQNKVIESEEKLKAFQKSPYSKTTLNKQEKEKVKDKEHLSNTLALATNLERSLEKNIDLLQSNKDNAHCPTCMRSLDDASGLLAQFRKEMEDNKSQMYSSKEKLKKVEHELDLIHKQKQELSEWTNNKQLTEKDIDVQKQFLTQAENSLTENIQEKESMMKDFNVEESRKELESINKEIFNQEKALEDLIEQGRNLLVSIQSFDEIETLASEVSIWEQEIIDLDKEKEKIILVEEVSLGSVEDAKLKYDKASEEHSKADAYSNSLEENYYMTKSDLAVDKERLSSLEEQKYSYARAKENYDKKIATSLLVSEFRKNTISRIAPEIAVSASSVVSAMTADEFTGITIDDEFTPTVIRADGRRDNMSILSGGEKSLVALAMLIGIGDLISGGTGGLLWLDEALVSQDATRRNLIVSTLRSLENRQIVMVNHTPDGNDLSDSVVELVKGDTGSYLRE